MQWSCWLCECPGWGARKCWGEMAPGQKPNLGDQDIRIPLIFKTTSNSRRIHERTDEFARTWQTREQETKPHWASPSPPTAPCLYYGM